jgi:hypothetical protein
MISPMTEYMIHPDIDRLIFNLRWDLKLEDWWKRFVACQLNYNKYDDYGRMEIGRFESVFIYMVPLKRGLIGKKYFHMDDCLRVITNLNSRCTCKDDVIFGPYNQKHQ